MYTREYLALVSLTLLRFEIASAALPIRVTDSHCLSNDEYCNGLNCSFVTIRNRIQMLNFEVEFIKSLNNILIHFQLFRKHKMGKFKPFLINATENVCKFLDDNERSNIISRLMRNWKHYGSLPHKCPIKGMVNIRRYPLDLSFFPGTFPAGEFQIIFNIIEGKKNVNVLKSFIVFEVKY